MITEERMRDLLESAARAYEPPADGGDRVLVAAAPFDPASTHRWRLPQVTWRRRSVRAAVAVVVVAAGLVVFDPVGVDRSAQFGRQGTQLSDSGRGSTGPPVQLRVGTTDAEQYVKNQYERSTATTIVGHGAATSGSGGATVPARRSVSIGEPAKVASAGALVVEWRRGRSTRRSTPSPPRSSGRAGTWRTAGRHRATGGAVPP